MKKYEIVITPEIFDAVIVEELELFHPVDVTWLIGLSACYDDGLGIGLLWSYYLPPYRMVAPLFNKRLYHEKFTELMRRSFPEALI